MPYIFLIFISGFFLSCQFNPLKPKKIDSNENLSLLKQQADDKQFENELSLVTSVIEKNSKKRSAQRVVSIVESPLPQVSEHKIPMKNDKNLYHYIYQAWRADKYDQVIASVSLMKSNFPGSKYVDDSLYILAMMDLRRGKPRSVLRATREVIDHHPKSLIMPNVLYLKSEAYRQMNLPDLSDQIRKDIVNKYPSSKLSRRILKENLRK